MARAKAILLVEDDRDTLDSWVELLQRAGYRVVAAASFEEGRHAMESAAPDMLITDIRLGPYNGLQLVVRARAVDPDLPVLVITGFHDTVLQAEAERLSAVYVRKPVDPDHLLATIAQAFGSAQSQTAL